MTQINAYLGFNGQCREAMNFYKDCLEAALTMQSVSETPMSAQCPESMKDHIMHAELKKNGLLLMATDMTPAGEEVIKGNNFALSLNCSSEEEIHHLFDTLSEGGKIIEPVKQQFWGALFGVFTDKFGIRWMLNFDKNQQ